MNLANFFRSTVTSFSISFDHALFGSELLLTLGAYFCPLCLSVYLSVCLSICLSVFLSVCLSVCLSNDPEECACDEEEGGEKGKRKK